MREKYIKLFKGGGPNLDIEQRKIDGIDVHFVAVEHRLKAMPYPTEQIQDLISSLPGETKILMEYFLPELEKTVFNDPGIGWYARAQAEASGINDFSLAIESIAKAEDKNILVMDPANSLMHDVHEIIIPTLSVAAGVGVGVQGLISRISRRRILAYFSSAIGATMAGSQALYADKIAEGGRTVNARDYRREMVARGLRQYGTSHEDETLVLLYPKKHRDAILYYSDHPEEPSFIKKTAYDLMPGITREIREYKSENGQWLKIGSTPIR